MKRLIILAAALGMSALNLQAQITPGPSGMPYSTAYALEYYWQKTELNFEATNPPTASNSGAPATDITTETAGKRVTQHFEAVPPRPTIKALSREETAARGGAYQYSYSLTGRSYSYNHDGRAFEKFNETIDIAILAHAVEFNKGYLNLFYSTADYVYPPEPGLTEYRKNIKSGKWHKLANGEDCKYSVLTTSSFWHVESPEVHAKVTGGITSEF
jgi:hypothetical protein